MSSILDALNKLEEERNRQLQQEQEQEEEDVPFEPEEAAAKLLTYTPPGQKRSGTPARREKSESGALGKWVTAAVSLLALAAVASSAVAVMMVYHMMQRTPPQQAYTLPVVVEPPQGNAAPSAPAASSPGKSVPAPGTTPRNATDKADDKRPAAASNARAASKPSAPSDSDISQRVARQIPPAARAPQPNTTPEPQSAPAQQSAPAAATPPKPVAANSAEKATPPSVASQPPSIPEQTEVPAVTGGPEPESHFSSGSPADQVPPDAPTQTRTADATPQEPEPTAADGLTPPPALPGNPPLIAPPALPVNPPAALRAPTPAAAAAQVASARGSAGFVEPEAVNALPRLTLADQERYGLGELRLNVLREAGPGNPDPVAIINLKKVYLGERIPGTRARLIGISSRAIAIEIEDTGARFRVSR